MADELRGLRVLVVEDEFLVALDLERMLQESGCEVAGPVGDLASAVRMAEEGVFDLALLDVNIGGEPVTAVAEALAGRAVPVVFCTGYQAGNVPDRFPGMEILMKPFQAVDVVAALRRAAAAGRAGPSLATRAGAPLTPS
jgi:DNA-binding NarL/FixJ family response regulator